MKKLLSCILTGVLAFGILPIFSYAAEADYSRFEGQGISLNVYNWGEYISNGEDDSLDVNAEFEERTGIKVNYTNFASNEELYAKLKSGGTSYDVIIPSDYMIAKLIAEDMLEKLNFENIPNFEYIDERFKNPEYDPANEYSVPYMWGVVGIIYNTSLVDEEEAQSWDILWDSRYIKDILMFSNSRDAFGIALKRLGYSFNTTDPEQLNEAADSLKEQKALVQAYVMDEIFDKMTGGEAALAPYYAGDFLTMSEDNPDLAFAIPKEGTNRFVDAVCIPKGSKQKEAAETYINFLCETEIALANCEYIGYSTPHAMAYEKLDEETRNNLVAYPGDEVLANTETFVNLPDETSELVKNLWTQVISTNTGDNKWAVPVLLLLAIAASVAINLWRRHKKKRDEALY